MVNTSLYTPAFLERFWAKANKNGPVPAHRSDLGACWIWTAAKTPAGYGQIGSGGKRGRTLYAHRVSFELAHHDLPSGYERHLDHLCRVTACVNPRHLEFVTCGENVARGLSPQRNRERADLQTYCVNGHEFTPENTYLRPGGKQRNCRACGRDRSRKHAATKQVRTSAP